MTTPVGGLKDFFQNEKMGFLAENRDPRTLAAMVEKLIKDKHMRHSVGLYNHLYAKDNFLASKAAQRLRRIYEQVIRESKVSTR